MINGIKWMHLVLHYWCVPEIGGGMEEVVFSRCGQFDDNSPRNGMAAIQGKIKANCVNWNHSSREMKRRRENPPLIGWLIWCCTFFGVPNLMDLIYTHTHTTFSPIHPFNNHLGRLNLFFFCIFQSRNGEKNTAEGSRSFLIITCNATNKLTNTKPDQPRIDCLTACLSLKCAISRRSNSIVAFASIPIQP